MIKIEKSNNPAAVGALVLVLALIVGRIVWMVFGHTASVSAASTASPATQAPNTPSVPATPSRAAVATTPAPAAKPHPLAAVPISTRNPFVAVVKPVPVQAHSDGLPQFSAQTRLNTVRGGDTPLGTLPPMPFQVAPIGDRRVALPITSPRKLGPLFPLPNPAGKQSEQTPDLKLTAIIEGTETLALVQTSTLQSVTLHIGDLIEGMRVKAIHEQEVVFARGTGDWTLRLQSAADSASPGPASVTTLAPDAPPAISVVTPEDNTDEKH